MKIIKTLIVMLSSVSLFASANAGELGVSGTAKATYNILSGKTNVSKGLGITNELNFTATGELDNGYTWSYSMELDPDAVAADNGAAQNDDTKLTVTTPMGTVGVFISEGGLDVEDAASQSVYARPTDSGDPSATVDNYTIDAYNNIQYHTPADMLPFGITAKIAYATGLDAYGSGNNAGQVITDANEGMGDSATEYQLKASPLDGLTVGASYMEFSGSGTANTVQDPESGAYYATYATGPFSIGYSKAYKAPIVGNLTAAAATVEDVDYYDQTNVSVAYAATEDLSVSYEREQSEANYVLNTTADVEQESTSVQIAYSMGGATLAIAHASHDNVGYSDGANQDQTLFAVTMAF
tara:strand:+ start:6535 stop:7596 length:1062 start_codon:yes stop_codon:yes gene_type:complete